MARYFFHLHDRGMTVHDREGRELPDACAIAPAALREARSIIGHDATDGRVRLSPCICVEDEAQVRVHTLHFADAVTISR